MIEDSSSSTTYNPLSILRNTKLQIKGSRGEMKREIGSSRLSYVDLMYP